MIKENKKEHFKRIIPALASLCSVSGSEYRNAENIKGMFGECFDSIESDTVGNLTFFKSCGRENAPKIMIDTHYDEIGFMVTDVLDGGFLRITNIGGIDRAIMQAACVTVYGKEILNGIIISTPPHLREGGNKLPKIEDLLVDVGLGYSKEELCELCPIGTPITFEKKHTELLEDKIAGPSLDNKACAAIALDAACDVSREMLSGDLYITLSCYEETARRGGAYVCANRINPDYALVIDVNLADAPSVPSRDSVKMGGGISISYSSSTDRALTRASARLCEENKISYIKKAEPSSTGTNAIALGMASFGVSVVDVGLPLRNMHTYNEVISLDDCFDLYSFVRAFISSESLAKDFCREEIDI